VIQHLRLARHTSDIERIKKFYIDVIGLKAMGGFDNHEGYDGVFLGLEDHSWHLEFTKTEEETKRVHDEDDLLVLYMQSEEEYNVLVDRLKSENAEFVETKNPYWRDEGVAVLDPDGNRIVVCNCKWD